MAHVTVISQDEATKMEAGSGLLPQNGDLQTQSSIKQFQEDLLHKLDVLLNGGYKDVGLRCLPENYFFIEDILSLPEFKQYKFADVHQAVHSDGKLRFSVRGSKIRLKPPELNKDPDVQLSKKLAWILRHGAEKEGIIYEDGGWIYMDDMMAVRQFSGVSMEDIYRVVGNNDKQRFQIAEHPESGRLRIRATQGHSVRVEGMGFRTIIDPEEFPVVIHGTYFKNWRTIQRTGLSKCGRTHVHFAPGEMGEDGVISGMRTSAEVLIYLDLEKALADGLKFVISENNVILSEGDEQGYIKPKYFKAVYQRRPRVELAFNKDG